MSASKPDWPQDFQALAQQYWNAWGDFARSHDGAAPEGSAAAPSRSWQQAIDWWTRLAHGGRDEANDALEHFNRQMRHGFGLMQDLAGRFAGQPASARDVASAWREAIGGNGAQPFPELFKDMHGHGLKGLEQWLDVASPYLDALRAQAMQGLQQPAFGLAREHQERWQRLLAARIDYQERANRYQALLAKAGENAFAIFEDKLAERSEPGRQIDSVRALFDLWIDAAEEAYAEVALSDEFRTVYRDLVDGQMRLRAAMQDEVERISRVLGLPTRSEVQASHGKVHALERELRRLRTRIECLENAAARSPEPDAASPRPVRRPVKAATAAAGKKTGAGKPARSGKADRPADKGQAPQAVKPRPARTASRRRN